MNLPQILDKNDFQIEAGFVSYNSSELPSNGQSRNVNEITVHPGCGNIGCGVSSSLEDKKLERFLCKSAGLDRRRKV